MIIEDGEGMCQCQDCARNDVDPKDASRSSMDYKVPEGEIKPKAFAMLAW